METTKFNLLFPLVIMLTLAVPAQVLAQQNEAPDAGGMDLLDMPLEKLLEIEVASTASLTKTTRRLTPATVTTITQDEIWSSGARNLDELLDIYVPSFQWIRHPWEYNHAGHRGIISDRDHKYLLLVNGKVMNERTHFGVFAERDLPMMRDIHQIDVVRGPGSALYGPGAISMVINIITENANTFQGSEVTGRLGAVEEFYSGEYKYGKKFDDGRGFYLYTGITDYLGADSGDAPFIWGRDRAGWGSIDGDAGDVIAIPTERDGQAYRDKAKWKLFADYTNGNFDLWARFTRGGAYYAPDLFGTMWDAAPGSYSSGYQQITVYASNKYEISETLSIDYAASYDSTSLSRLNAGGTPDNSHREDEYYYRLITKWNPNESHSLAFGGEYSHEEFGFEYPGFPASDAISGAFSQSDSNLPFYNPTGKMPRWSTDMYSFLGEYQWNMTPEFTTFVGGRMDWHPYIPRMFSPRVVLVYTPTDIDTVKTSFSRSVRAPQAAEVYKEFWQNDNHTEPEKISVWEVRWERQHTEKLWLAASLFHQDQDVVGAASGIEQVGTLKTWGAEVELTYKTEKFRFIGSHSFTKLYDFDDANTSTYPPSLTDRDGGYGHDLMNWSNHATKFIAQYKANDWLSLDGSLRIYWGFPGQRDWADWCKETIWADWQQWCFDPDHEDTFAPSAFLNLGIQLDPAENLSIRIDGYNLLGMFDEDLNKRFLAFDQLSPADARASAPALGVSLKYKF